MSESATLYKRAQQLQQAASTHDDALALYLELVTQFPDSLEAEPARQQVQALMACRGGQCARGASSFASGLGRKPPHN